MDLDLSSVEIFARVAELGSFSKAAVSLGLAQPTISRVVGDLERRFSGQLFYRTGRGAKLTELGELILPRAHALLRTAEQLSADALAFGNTPVGAVSVACLPSLTQNLAPMLYSYVQERAPGIRLRLLEGFSDQIERWVSEGVVDIGLFSKYKNVDPSRDDVLFLADLMLVHSRATRPTVAATRFAELHNLPMVLPSPTNGLRALLEETARRHRITLKVVMEADSLVAQREVVRLCGCYSVLARQALEGLAPQEELLGAPIIDAGFERYVVTATTQQRPLSKAARVILQAIRNIVAAKMRITSLRDLSATLAVTS
jgi:DNA-binding transcriptional LysR family regulator